MIVTAIDAYQAWVSPYKGFRCAHNVLHGRGGCSGFGKRAFTRFPALMAWQLLQLRFAECRAAYGLLMSETPEERRRRRQEVASSYCDATLDGASCCDGIGACDIPSP